MNVMRTLDPSSQTPQNKTEPTVNPTHGRNLSPAEERALQAEQRAASRQARSVCEFFFFAFCNFPFDFQTVKDFQECLCMCLSLWNALLSVT